MTRGDRRRRFTAPLAGLAILRSARHSQIASGPSHFISGYRPIFAFNFRIDTLPSHHVPSAQSLASFLSLLKLRNRILNPVEQVWDEVREKWFANRVFDSMATLEDQLVIALTALEADARRVASLTGFDWIQSIPLNAN